MSSDIEDRLKLLRQFLTRNDDGIRVSFWYTSSMLLIEFNFASPELGQSMAQHRLKRWKQTKAQHADGRERVSSMMI
jgi:hypothetical protein